MPTCLIVDDDPGQRTLTRMVVEDLGRFDRIVEAADGRQAIRRARAEQPEVVLLDLTMPVLDGWRALPGLRRCSPGSTIIVCSMVQEEEKLHEAKLAGAHGFLDKALPMERFSSVLRELIREGQALQTPVVPRLR